MPTNIEIVQAGLDAFGHGDISAVLNMCSDNVDVVFAGPSTIPFAGRWTGKARVSEYFQHIGESVDVTKWQPTHHVVNGDRVASFGIMSLRAKATGKTVVDTPWALDFTVGNGKITRWQVYADTAATEKALAAPAVK